MERCAKPIRCSGCRQVVHKNIDLVLWAIYGVRASSNQISRDRWSSQICLQEVHEEHETLSEFLTVNATHNGESRDSCCFSSHPATRPSSSGGHGAPPPAFCHAQLSRFSATMLVPGPNKEAM